MAKLVTLIADNSKSPYLTFDREFWDEQKMDLFDAIIALGESMDDPDSEQVRSVKNLYWFVHNIDARLDDNDVVVIIPSEGMYIAED